MLFGPVCHYELIRLARRKGFFILRFLFGLILLGVLGMNYLGLFLPRYFTSQQTGTYSIHELAVFGQALFISLMTAQAVIVIGLTPALVADAIASERQRKTLHYLLTSRLGSVDIVVGKAAARLLNLGVYVALTLPVTSLLTLFGGVDPEALLWGDAAIAASAFFLGSLAILVSVWSRRPRDAVGSAYGLAVLWMLAPLAFAMLPNVPPWDWLETALDWVWPASPFALLTNSQSLYGGGPEALRALVGWMVVSQVAYGTLWLALAAWRLRPAFRHHEGRSARRVRWRGRALRLWPRPACGNDPIYWKEAYVSRSGGGIIRIISQLAMATIWLGLVGLGLYLAYWAALEAWSHGFSAAGWGGARQAFNLFIRIGGGGLIAIWLIGLAGATAASIAQEREADTWVSLLATPLEGPEILRGKILGILRGSAPLGITVGVFWILGLLVGSLHPIGLLAGGLCLTLAVWFVISLGMFLSLRLQTVWKAQAWAQAILIAPHFCCLLPIPSLLVLIGYSLVSYRDLGELLRMVDGGFTAPGRWPMLLVVGYFVGGIAIYAGTAFGFTSGLLAGFNRVADRPRRMWVMPVKPKEALVELPGEGPAT